ncbi:LysM peptidoglycan-binding domain-containing protein [Pseudogracilibacillus auburnensis]|uniref:Spore germination protein n=1 Tax=Pseudogracilibacillus auburnensis TaxID=1494959 RepID=A0A2V3VNZ1_9BACI|nr:glycoside hydrolase family 18 protein [Pseudogracilibacillus auburnensis]PXW83573.1 spore germination protein [Pseudogracilibacillus auburnensis]
MQIHVVQSGQTLFSIANTYNSSIYAITEANELETPNLVVGQALVIPIVGQYYFVQPGDSLFSIARQFNMSVEALARINNLQMNTVLPVGLRLYIPPRPRRPITAFGYIEPIGGTVSPVLENAAEKNSPFLTFLAPFSYRVNRDGSLTAPPLNRFREIAENNRTNLSFVVTNLEGTTFNSELAHIVLTVQAVQNRMIDEIINTATANGFNDVHFDFEFIPQDDREAYNAFLRKVKPRLTQAGLLLSTALAPKTSSTQRGLLYEAHDYAAHGEIVDFLVLMTYEWGYSAGPPLPVSPINEVQRVLNYAITEIPANKILMGQNLYGYDWTLPFVRGESFARAISPQQAIRLAREHHVAIQYDETAQAPFFHYVDVEGKEHVVWFEDARSIQAKFNLIKQLDLLGIAYWKLGLAFPQNWLLLNDNFIITKKQT